MFTDFPQAMSLAVSLAALLLSLVALFTNMRTRDDQREVVLLQRRTELVDLISRRQSHVGHIELLYLQKLQLLQAHPDPDEEARLRSNLAVLQKEHKNCSFLLNKLYNSTPTDLRAFEDMLLTAKQFLNHIAGEREKEQGTLDQLRDDVSKRASQTA